tara:strand:- start:50 stop:406 length:357 start_codon:yes stop_codon:yes gene_type:complete
MKVKELIQQLQASNINQDAEVVLKSGNSGDAFYFDLWFDNCLDDTIEFESDDLQDFIDKQEDLVVKRTSQLLTARVETCNKFINQYQANSLLVEAEVELRKSKRFKELHANLRRALYE